MKLALRQNAQDHRQVKGDTDVDNPNFVVFLDELMDTDDDMDEDDSSEDVDEELEFETYTNHLPDLAKERAAYS
ncbi:hypothetical protein BU25DRAFT_462304 [Macroventuria anomochaeta]|uniref:Uncharacterized protein n=1 Tax=Macroventuria anomochaeta TaxID=301207 RepID=A0ACB6RN06_9PLEO|nr:uncharacterized protein BU25DRAFT_462304 [Macroventuria anomochaeta]KAF2623164.1 hypothetical protein BU25DRAFT_462304 [Macroventuria anomochaeta]